MNYDSGNFLLLEDGWVSQAGCVGVGWGEEQEDMVEVFLYPAHWSSIAASSLSLFPCSFRGLVPKSGLLGFP